MSQSLIPLPKEKPATPQNLEQQMVDIEFTNRTGIGEALLSDPISKHGFNLIPRRKGLLDVRRKPGLTSLGRAHTDYDNHIDMSSEVFEDEALLSDTMRHEAGHVGGDNLRDKHGISEGDEEVRQRLRDAKLMRGSSLYPKEHALEYINRLIDANTREDASQKDKDTFKQYHIDRAKVANDKMLKVLGGEQVEKSESLIDQIKKALGRNLDPLEQPSKPKVPFVGVPDEVIELEDRIRDIATSNLNPDTKKRLLLNEAEKGKGFLGGFPGFREAEQRVRQAVKMGLEFITPGGDRVSEITDKFQQGDTKGALFDVPPAIAQAAVDIASAGMSKAVPIGKAIFAGIAAKNVPDGLQDAQKFERYLETTKAGEVSNESLDGFQRRALIAEPNYSKDEIQHFIHEATGWFKGPDGKWRWEIDDSKAKITMDHKRNPVDLSLEDEISSIQHDDLFEAYPQLRSIKIVKDETLKGTSTWGSFSPAENTIRYSPDATKRPEELLKTMLHEYQHAVQTIEGFAKGSSVVGEMAKPTLRASKIFERQMKLEAQLNKLIHNDLSELLKKQGPKLEDFENKSDFNRTYLNWKKEATKLLAETTQPKLWEEIQYLDAEYKKLINTRIDSFTAEKNYMKQAGEIESRDVERRIDMDNDQRRRTLPGLLAVKKDNMIVEMDDGTVLSQKPDPIDELRKQIDRLQAELERSRKIIENGKKKPQSK